MSKVKWTLVEKKLSEIHPHPENPRIIKGKGLDDLKKSVEKFGMAQPVVINTDGTILSGHARYYILLEQKAESVDCYVPDRTFTKEEEKEALVRFNKNIAGQWDTEALANFFDMGDLRDWGFQDHDFGNFSFGSEKEQGKLDEIEESAGGEGRLYTCPACNHKWTAEKKEK